MGRDLHVHTHPSSVEHWRHLIEIVALLIAAVWGFYVFVYQERIKPESEPPKLLTTSEVNHWPLTANNELVKTAITLKNNGDVPLRLGFFAVNIYGNKYQTSPPTHLWSGENRQFRFAASTQRLARRKMLGSVLFKRRWFGGEGEGDLNPTQAVTFYPPMVVKRGEYDTVTVEWITCSQRDSNDTMTKVQVPYRSDGAVDLDRMLRSIDPKTGVQCDVWYNDEFAI